MGRGRKPSGLPDGRIGDSALGGMGSYDHSPVGLRPDGVRRVRNAFAAISLALGACMAVLVLAGNPDFAFGMLTLVVPTVLFTVISQLILWYAEEHR